MVFTESDNFFVDTLPPINSNHSSSYSSSPRHFRSTPQSPSLSIACPLPPPGSPSSAHPPMSTPPVSSSPYSNFNHSPNSTPLSSPNKAKVKTIGPYQLGKTLGRGSFCKVKLGVHHVTGAEVCDLFFFGFLQPTWKIALSICMKHVDPLPIYSLMHHEFPVH
jgi:hypothetical protein